VTGFKSALLSVPVLGRYAEQQDFQGKKLLSKRKRVKNSEYFLGLIE
jgi:hypothetical protein